MFLHKPLYLNAPDDPELAATSIRYVPMPARSRLDAMIRTRSICGWSPAAMFTSAAISPSRHIRQIWAPSAGFIVSDSGQEVIGIKEVGLVEYRFQPDSFEVRHVRAPGQTDVDLESLLAMVPKSY